MNDFSLHPRLQEDSLHILDLPLCKLLLMNDQHYPWFILVPMKKDLSEIFQLSEADQHQLLKESAWVSEYLLQHFRADKLNIAALGNMVPQLHVHHIARFKTDPAWPAPVWGKFEAKPYSSTEANIVIESVSQFMKGKLLHEAN